MPRLFLTLVSFAFTTYLFAQRTFVEFVTESDKKFFKDVIVNSTLEESIGKQIKKG
ncbi:MAG: hypothetical protein KI790_17500 [Cyclobacteriaceae bacterium]|nr:hypothetical protein [Cyclobacteriaceae bacterium HetDA_MAG_MS6]